MVYFAILLLISSAIIYFINFLLFQNINEELFLLVEELAFLPISVLVVTLIIDRLLKEQDKRSRLDKLNMVIGAFFTDVGTELLKSFIQFDSKVNIIRPAMQIGTNWKEHDFESAKSALNGEQAAIICRTNDLEDLKEFMTKKRDFLLRLLENPNLLEHESFTDLLWAVTHVIEELISRRDLNQLTKEDSDHIVNDIKRAYLILVSQWLDYMKHLNSRYPYLYSLSVRTNPFNSNAKAEIGF